jgi:hypothetical protein
MPTLPTAIPNPSLPLPDPGDKLTFSARKLEDLRWSRQDAVPGIIAAATVSYDNAVEAAASAAAATSNGSAQVALAQGHATNAAASAASAINAPGTNATSTTSMAVGTGSRALTIQTGKAYSVGQSVVIARTSDPAGVRMGGVITAHNSGTGSLTVSVSIAVGSGTYTDWTVSIGLVANSGILPASVITSNTSATVNIDYQIDANSIVLTAPTSKAVGDLFQYQLMNSRTGCSVDFGTDKAWGRTPGVMELVSANSRAKLKWSGATYGWVEA